jgi:hypothetical protein
VHIITHVRANKLVAIAVVNRRLLTPKFVDDFQPPAKGEIWISDTQQRGFGLRAWASKNGGSKAFAVRATNPQNQVMRSSYVPTAYQSWASLQEYITLGDMLEDARE